MGKFLHECEGEIVCESINPKIPYFNAPIYLENKVYDSNTNSGWSNSVDSEYRRR